MILSVVAGRAGVGKAAGALDEVQSVVIAPRLDVVLPDEVQRTDQLHARKIPAVQLWHHGLELSAVQHPHEIGFNYIVKVMPQSNLVASQLLRVAIEVSPAHPGAQVAGGFLHIVNRLENVGFKDSDRNSQKARIVLNDAAVFRVVAGIHDHIPHIKRNRAVTL